MCIQHTLEQVYSMFDTDDDPTEESIDVTDPVLGNTTMALSGGDYKVLGEIGTADSTGVRGHATLSGTDAATCGVEGRADANGNADTGLYPTGVVGKTSGSGRTFGVRGSADGSKATGVIGDATSGGLVNLSAEVPIGVVGYTDRSGGETGVSAAGGVYGASKPSTSGETYGVVGEVLTGSAETGGYAVYSIGDMRVEGHQRVRDLGASVWLSNFQTIPNSSWTTVDFNEVVADDRGEWNNNGNHEFTCATDGDYYVSTTIAWRSKDFSGDTFLELAIEVNGSDRALRTEVIPSSITDSGVINQHVCKTLRNLKEDDAIRVQVRQTTGSDEFLDTGRESTYLTIDKVG